MKQLTNIIIVVLIIAICFTMFGCGKDAPVVPKKTATKVAIMPPANEEHVVKP